MNKPKQRTIHKRSGGRAVWLCRALDPRQASGRPGAGQTRTGLRWAAHGSLRRSSVQPGRPPPVRSVWSPPNPRAVRGLARARLRRALRRPPDGACPRSILDANRDKHTKHKGGGPGAPASFLSSSVRPAPPRAPCSNKPGPIPGARQLGPGPGNAWLGPVPPRWQPSPWPTRSVLASGRCRGLRAARGRAAWPPLGSPLALPRPVATPLFSKLDGISFSNNLEWVAPALSLKIHPTPPRMTTTPRSPPLEYQHTTTSKTNQPPPSPTFPYVKQNLCLIISIMFTVPRCQEFTVCKLLILYTFHAPQLSL